MTRARERTGKAHAARPSAGLRAVAVTLAVSAAAWLGAPAPAATQPVAPVVESVYRGGGFQDTLPGSDAATQIGPPERGPSQTAEPVIEPQPQSPLVPLLEPALRLLFWLALAAAGTVAVVWIVSRMSFARRRRPTPDVAAPAGPDTAPAPTAETAAGLAADGYYGEAIHALLLTALGDLAGRLGSPPLSATSREIAVAVAAPGGRTVTALAEALDAMVGAVEQSRFAARQPGAGDYERCRAAYARFAASLAEQP